MELTITKDTQELERLEAEMRQDQIAFYRFGSNLIRIRDRELYLLKNGGAYQTFEAYCKGEWDMTGRYARNLIASSGVIDNLTGTIVPVKPLTESQCRPLARLEPQQQREAWQQAVATAPDGKVTAAHVYKIVKGMTGEEKAEPEKEGDSYVLSELKRFWKRAGKKDRAIFSKWMEEEI